MRPISTAIIAGALVIAGKWARGKTPNIDNAIGIGGIALGVATLRQFDAQLSESFSVLIIVSLVVAHLPTITDSLGFTSH